MSAPLELSRPVVRTVLKYQQNSDSLKQEVIAGNLHKVDWRDFGWGLSGATLRLTGKFSFLRFLEVQRKQTRRFIELSAMKVDRLFLLVIPLLFLSGPFLKAGPVGDFFKKVGHSIAKPLQREPQAPPPPPTRPQPTAAPHVTRRSSSRAAPATASTPPAESQPSHSPKDEESTAPVRTVSAADIEKVKAGLPYAVPVPGRKGMVTSPYLPEDGKYIDVTDFPSGSVVKDPYTGKFFLVP